MLDTSEVPAVSSPADVRSPADVSSPAELTTRPAPAASVRPRRSGTGKRWTSRLIVLLMLAGAVFGGIKLAEYRAAQQARIDLGTVTLSAQPTAVSTLATGVVKSVDVQARESVTAGQTLGTLSVVTVSPTSPSRTVTTTQPLKAPSDGVVAGEPAPVGSTLQPGQAFVQLYDPMKYTLVADVPISRLTHIGAGMGATLQAPGIGHPVRATVERVVPRVGTEGTGGSKSAMQLVLSPVPAADVASLVPGFQFTGFVTADPGGTPSRGVLGVS